MAESCSCFWKENWKNTVRHGGWAGGGGRGETRGLKARVESFKLSSGGSVSTESTVSPWEASPLLPRSI